MQALPLHVAGEAPDARFVASHIRKPNRGRRIDTEARHHAVHQLGLAHNPAQHRAGQAKVAHGITSFAIVRIL
jgi:hypothetical protein